MSSDRSLFPFHEGDHVSLDGDSWDMAGRDLVLVEIEPEPGSTQCVILADGERLVVSRNELRPAPVDQTPD